MKTVIEMAGQAFETPGTESAFRNGFWTVTQEELERFAELVRADEREACAKVCETLGVHPALNVYAGGPDWYKHGKECAAAIRARSNT